MWPRSQVPALWIPNRCHSYKGEAKAIHSSEKSPGSWSLAMCSEDPRYSPIPDSLSSVYYTPAIVFVGVTPAFPVVGTECNTRQDSVPLRAKEATPPGRGRCGSLGHSVSSLAAHTERKQSTEAPLTCVSLVPARHSGSLTPPTPLHLCLLRQSLSQAGLSSEGEIVCRGVVTVPVSAVTSLAGLFWFCSSILAILAMYAHCQSSVRALELPQMECSFLWLAFS